MSLITYMCLPAEKAVTNVTTSQAVDFKKKKARTLDGPMLHTLKNVTLTERDSRSATKYTCKTGWLIEWPCTINAAQNRTPTSRPR